MTDNASVTKILREIVAEYPAPPPAGPALRLVLHDPEIYVSRTAYDMQLVIDRLGTDITVLDMGGGFGLFALGFARLGAKAIVIDDFDWLDQADIGPTVFGMFDKYGVEVINRDIMNPEPFPASDAIGMFHVMEHLHNSPKDLFGRCMASLRSGGVLVISGPNCQNLRKRIQAPLGKVKWSTMVDWYEKPVFRAHVREPDVADLRYIADDLHLQKPAVLGRNFLGMRSTGSFTRRVAVQGDALLSRWPQFCSDIYLVGQKP